MKILDMSIMINCRIVTRGNLFPGVCVSEVLVVNQKADKERENQKLLRKFSFFKKYTTYEVLGEIEIF